MMLIMEIIPTYSLTINRDGDINPIETILFFISQYENKKVHKFQMSNLYVYKLCWMSTILHTDV